MDAVGLLVKAILREKPYELLLSNYKYLEFVNSVLADEYSTKALEATLDCTIHHGQCPENLDEVLHFVRTNPLHTQKYEKSEGFDDQLIYLQKDDEVSKVGSAALVDSLYHKAFDTRVAAIYNTCSKIATGAIENPHTKERGPAAADEYVALEKTKLVVKGLPEIGGEIRDNLDHVATYINNFSAGDSKRLYTGFEKIDETTLIGKRQSQKWIGILGYTHHGKSLFLMSLLYRMACHGSSVMLVPRESSVEAAWMSFVWLHHARVCPERPIASKAEWMREGPSVGAEKYQTIQFILNDLKNNNSLPGKLFVFPCSSWEDIEDRLRLTNKKNKYDVLAIDYFGHLDTEGGNKKDTDIDKHKKSLRKAQMLSQSGIDNDQSGLVIITPLQANKKGHDEAAKREGDNYGVYESLGAVEYFTQAAQDMDCVMSVWHEGDKCIENNPKQMMIHCLKGRENQRFQTHWLKIHPQTGLLCDHLNGDDEPQLRMETANSLSDVDTQDVLYTKTSLNTDDWGV
jgi:hypothetical protein